VFRFLLWHLICFTLVLGCWFLCTLRMYAGSSVVSALVVGFASNCLLPCCANGRQYLQAVLRQNIAFFDRLGAGEVTNRISHDVDLIQDGISDKVDPLSLIPFNIRYLLLFRQYRHSFRGSLLHSFDHGNSLSSSSVFCQPCCSFLVLEEHI